MLQPSSIPLTQTRELDPELPDPYYKICEKSKGKVWKPDRSHYCRISKKLVPRMDHYCPFVLTTIGLNNHAMFLLLCMYHTIGIALGYGGFLYWVYQDAIGFLGPLPLYQKLLIPSFLMIDSLAILSLCSFTAYMAKYHLQYCFNNITTIDWLKKFDRESGQGVDNSNCRGIIYSLQTLGISACSITWIK